MAGRGEKACRRRSSAPMPGQVGRLPRSGALRTWQVRHSLARPGASLQKKAPMTTASTAPRTADTRPTPTAPSLLNTSPCGGGGGGGLVGA